MPELAHPLGLVALVAPVLAALAWWRWRSRPELSRRRSRVALAVRLLLLTALALALAGPELASRPSVQTMVVAADRSASTLGASAAEPAMVAALAEHKGAKDRLGVVTFGGNAEVEAVPSARPVLGPFGTRPDPNATSIESALRLAGSLLPTTTRGHVVVVSDGRQNVGDAIRQARLLRAQGVRVDVWPLNVGSGPEVRVDRVTAPSTVPGGTRPKVDVVIGSNVATTAKIRMEVDGAVVSTVTRQVTAGVTQVAETLPALAAGLHTVKAVISPARDTLAENNVGEALVQALGTQRVLVVAGQPGSATNLAAALRASSLAVTVVDPALVPRSAGALAGYQAVALVDVSAAELGQARMSALATATRDLGVGLAAFGGPDTFGPGGWADTPLEQAMPVDMRVSNRDSKPPVAVVLVMESVENPAGDAVVRGAAKSLVAKLTPQDFAGVTNGSSGFAVPLQRVSHPARIEHAIATIPGFGDPPSYVPYLREAEKALERHPLATKHVILLGDGDAQPPPPSLVADMVHHGITVSAVGIDLGGPPQFMANMRAVAKEGNGRYYQSSSAAQVPDIFLRAARTQLKPWIVHRRFRPSIGAPSPALAGLDLGRLPALTGYVATTPKVSAQVVLDGPGGDPILAQWRYGLGRAVAWTSDVRGRWTAGLLRWPGAGRLLAGIVASTLPLAPAPGLRVTTTLSGGQAHVIAQVPRAPGGAVVTDTVVAPDGTSSQAGLVATGPGRYEGTFPADQVGSYLERVTVKAGGPAARPMRSVRAVRAMRSVRAVRAVTTGLVVSYSPEYRFVGTDHGFLAALARAGGGTIIHSAAQAFGAPVPAVVVDHSLVWWLLALAALLVPVDVAVRRLAGRSPVPARVPVLAGGGSLLARPARRGGARVDGDGAPVDGDGEPVDG
ncbi:MAG: VWA domain-containing protein, partial [Acidimicrobiales bacterium]